jgi:hypothetical protein
MAPRVQGRSEDAGGAEGGAEKAKPHGRAEMKTDLEAKHYRHLAETAQKLARKEPNLAPEYHAMARNYDEMAAKIETSARAK